MYMIQYMIQWVQLFQYINTHVHTYCTQVTAFHFIGGYQRKREIERAREIAMMMACNVL